MVAEAERAAEQHPVYAQLMGLTADDDGDDDDDASIEFKTAGKPADPCPTKPFHQCAGMNFTQTKDEKDAYNVTAGANQFACCPAGTSCVTFGPVWGMCMPSWGGGGGKGGKGGKPA